MSLGAALSAFGALNGNFFSGGRICFVAAREGHMVRKFWSFSKPLQSSSRFLPDAVSHFLAGYPGDGSRPQTDSFSSPDLLHHHLPDCVDPSRLPEHYQLFQVVLGPSLHAFCIFPGAEFNIPPYFIFSFTAWLFYAITVSGLLYLKIKKPELPRSTRVSVTSINTHHISIVNTLLSLQHELVFSSLHRCLWCCLCWSSLQPSFWCWHPS